MDPVTAWFVLAWDAFKAPVFPYDEALRLARAVGVDLERNRGQYLRQEGQRYRSVGQRSNGQPRCSRAGRRIACHARHATPRRPRCTRAQTGCSRELLRRAVGSTEPTFRGALEAVLEVLPASANFSQD